MTTLATLAQAREAFRQSPNQSTALAYMDAAIKRWEETWIVATAITEEHDMHAACVEVRDWLTIRLALATPAAETTNATR